MIITPRHLRRPNLSARALRRRSARTQFFLCLYALAQTTLITEIIRLATAM